MLNVKDKIASDSPAQNLKQEHESSENVQPADVCLKEEPNSADSQEEKLELNINTAAGNGTTTLPDAVAPKLFDARLRLRSDE